MIRNAAILLTLVLALAGCGSFALDRPGRIPSYRYLPQNAPANAGYEPVNSLPR